MLLPDVLERLERDVFTAELMLSVGPTPVPTMAEALVECDGNEEHAQSWIEYCEEGQTSTAPQERLDYYVTLLDTVHQLAEVKKLHRPASEKLLPEACMDGACDHYDPEECLAAAATYEVCNHCLGLVFEIDDETSRWDGVALWPCATAMAFGVGQITPAKEAT